jgi:hypothetical protein
MQWLLDSSENYRAHLRQGPFFTNLSRAGRPNDLQWVHQLVHQSREFTQALCLRYSLCRWMFVPKISPCCCDDVSTANIHHSQLLKREVLLRRWGQERRGVVRNSHCHCTLAHWASSSSKPLARRFLTKLPFVTSVRSLNVNFV